MKRASVVAVLGFAALLLVGVAVTAGVAAMRAAGDDDSKIAADAATATEQRSTGGGVEVTAFLATPAHLRTMDATQAEQVDLGSQVAIILKVDTHQGDLRNFDFAGAARLAASTGPEEAPASWVVMNDNSHHLEGMLLFPRQPRDTTRLTLRGLGGVEERSFSFPGQE